MVVDLWMCVAARRVVNVANVDNLDALDQILLDLPIMKEHGQHVRIDVAPLRRYEDFAADVKKRLECQPSGTGTPGWLQGVLMGWAGSVTGGQDFPYATRPTWFACARRDVMTLDRKYLVWAMGYAAVGMCLGIFMAATHDSEQIEAHSHTLLIGFVFSLGYGVIHKLWLAKPRPAIAGIQFILHQAGALTMAVGLFLLYGDMLSDALLEPILGIASFAVLGGAVLMAYMIIKEDAVKT